MYGLCFRMCLIGALERIEVAYRYRRTPYIVHVTIEDGDPNYGDAKRIFEETRVLAVKQFGVDPIGTFRTATKKKCPELMVADFMAYTRFMLHTGNFEGASISDEDLAALGLPVTEPLPQNLYSISFDPDMLKKLPAHIAMLNSMLRPDGIAKS